VWDERPQQWGGMESSWSLENDHLVQYFRVMLISDSTPYSQY